MTPDKLLQEMARMGFPINRSTLTRYVQWKLISPPEQRSGGKGVKASYPEHALWEALAAAELMGNWRWRRQEVALARRFFAELERAGIDVGGLNLDELAELNSEPNAESLRALLRARYAKIWWDTVKYFMFKTKLNN